MSELRNERIETAKTALPSGDGWIRAIIQFVDDKLELRYARINAGTDLPIPPSKSWAYEGLVFIAEKVEMAAVTESLSNKASEKSKVVNFLLTGLTRACLRGRNRTRTCDLCRVKAAL